MDQISAARSANSKTLEEWVDEMFATVNDGKKHYVPMNKSLERALCRVFYLDTTAFIADEETTRWKTKSHEEYEEIVQQMLSSGQRGRIRYGVLLDSMIKKRIDGKIFVTENSRLGMASDKVFRGDIITMLLGGQVPIILRPLDETTRQYAFVGECYVHGFIDGESLIDARRSADPEYDPTDVSWLERLHVEAIPFPTQEFHIH